PRRALRHRAAHRGPQRRARVVPGRRRSAVLGERARARRPGGRAPARTERPGGGSPRPAPVAPAAAEPAGRDRGTLRLPRRGLRPCSARPLLLQRVPTMLDLALVLAFVAYSVTAGFLNRKAASEGLESYFLAGRSMRGWQAGTSMAATQFAVDTPLTAVGLVAVFGIYMGWTFWIYGLAFLLLGLLFGPLWRRARVLTDAELAEVRYGGPGVLTLRVLKAIYYGAVFNSIVLAFVLAA